ncbi:hypothetical protein C4A75_00210 [Brevibacillus laterosporus]|uniref:hypothetical protein n=1 Tax=Brevibacillus laterosporus TaxID=1465 RepID=UPI000CE422A8|nr:hypothetical protein [Brevibacillus laterosporus]PPA87678.1 hypothetical protein C4A75_00210 [Brevibacillus laterosporus]
MKIKIGLKDGFTIYTETFQEGMAFLKPMDEKDWLVTKDAVVPFKNIEYIKRIKDKSETTGCEKITYNIGNIKSDKEIPINNLAESIVEKIQKEK